MLAMSPRTERQFEEIRETRKKAIMDTALELFATEGFDKTSISKIAVKAGISKGLLYNYFSSKEDLIKTIIFNGLDSLTGYIDPNHDGVLTRDELQYFIEEFFNAIEKNEHYWRLYFTLFFQRHVLKLVEKRLIVMIHTYMKMLVRYFEAKGSDDPETDAIMLGAVLDGIGFHFMANTATFPVEKIKQKLIKMYC
jgi:AcrR family transcriptional regulator